MKRLVLDVAKTWGVFVLLFACAALTFGRGAGR